MKQLSASLRVLGILLGLGLSACSSSRPHQVFTWHDGQQPLPLDYETVLATDPIQPEDDLKIYSLGRTDDASYHLVQIQTAEPLHIHRTHEGTATLLRGRGSLRVGKDLVAMEAGDVASIPKNTIHAYTNEGDKPSLLYVVFVPPYAGKDRVIVKLSNGLLK